MLHTRRASHRLCATGRLALRVVRCRRPRPIYINISIYMAPGLQAAAPSYKLGGTCWVSVSFSRASRRWSSSHRRISCVAAQCRMRTRAPTPASAQAAVHACCSAGGRCLEVTLLRLEELRGLLRRRQQQVLHASPRGLRACVRAVPRECSWRTADRVQPTMYNMQRATDNVQHAACNRQRTTCSVQPTTYNMQRATEPQGCNSALPRGECALRNARPHRSVIRRQHEQKPADLFPQL